MPHLTGKRILIIVTDGFEQSELEVPRDHFKEHGAEVHIAAPHVGEIKGWKEKNWGSPVPVDKALEEASEADYDALVIPGGVISPDKLRTEGTAIELINAFNDAGKVIAAICHGPWLLAEAGILEGRNITSVGSIRTDMENAGALWADEAVVTDDGIVTSRTPADLDAFCNKITEEVLEGKHERRQAA